MKQMIGEEMNPQAVEAFGNRQHPIPGQSLTSDPEQRRPFESAPDFTDFREALNFVALELLEEEAYTPMVLAIGDGVTITDLAMQIGYVGFREGKWNPDLMMMLMEPIMYLLMSLAEKAGIKYRIDDEDDENIFDMQDGDMDEEESILVEKAKVAAQMVKEKKEKNTGRVPAGVLPTEVVAKLEDIPEINLLDKQENSIEEEPQSLLERGQ